MAKTRQSLEALNADPRRVQAALELVADLQDHFAERDERYRFTEQVVFNEIDPFVPESYEKTTVKVKSPLPFHIVNIVAAALSTNLPQVHFQTPGFGDQAEIEAARRRRFFTASWARQEEEAEMQILRRFIWSMVVYGEGVIKTVERTKTAWAGYSQYVRKLRAELDDPKGPYRDLDPEAREKVFDAKTEEFKRSAPYPICSLDVPPMTFYYVKGEQGFTTAVEVKHVPYFETLARFQAGLDRLGRVVPQAMGMPSSEWGAVMSGLKTLRLIEVWTPEKVLYLLQGPGNHGYTGARDRVDGLLVRELAHGYGDRELGVLRGPYFHAFGLTTASREPHKQGMGVLAGFLDLFLLLNSLLTIQSNAAYMTGFPTFKRLTPKGALLVDAAARDPEFDGLDALEASGAMAEEEIQVGHIYPYDIAPLDQPRSGIDLDKALAVTRSLIDLALPAIAAGHLQSDEAGYAVNQALHQAKLRWDPIIRNAERALSRRVGFESWLIENRIKERVYVPEVDPTVELDPKRRRRRDRPGWLSIGPEELNGIHRYEVELQAVTPTNELLELRAIETKLKLRLISPSQAVEATGQNPVEVEREWLLFELKQDPDIRNNLKQAVFRELSTLEQQRLMGTPPVGGAPPDQAKEMAALQQLMQGGAPAPTAAGAMVPGVAEQPWSIGPAQGPTGRIQTNLPPGPTPGSPGGVRNPPPQHQPTPGGG